MQQDDTREELELSEIISKAFHLVAAGGIAFIIGHHVWRGRRSGSDILVRVVELEAHTRGGVARGEGDDEAHHRGQRERARGGRSNYGKVLGGVDKVPFIMLVSVVAASCFGDRNLRYQVTKINSG